MAAGGHVPDEAFDVEGERAYRRHLDAIQPDVGPTGQHLKNLERKGRKDMAGDPIRSYVEDTRDADETANRTSEGRPANAS